MNILKERKYNNRIGAKTCVICGQPAFSHFNGVPYCRRHYLQMRRGGIKEKTNRDPNELLDMGSFVKIILYNRTGEKIQKTGLIDKADLPLIEGKRIGQALFGGKNYCYINVDGNSILLHRYLWEKHNGKIPKDNVIDHINGDGMDCRLENLRLASALENSYNLSRPNKITGVNPYSKDRYSARIMSNGKDYNLGIYDNIKDAVNARIEAERKYFGAFGPNVSRYERGLLNYAVSTQQSHGLDPYRLFIMNNNPFYYDILESIADETRAGNISNSKAGVVGNFLLPGATRSIYGAYGKLYGDEKLRRNFERGVVETFRRTFGRNPTIDEFQKIRNYDFLNGFDLDEGRIKAAGQLAVDVGATAISGGALKGAGLAARGAAKAANAFAKSKKGLMGLYDAAKGAKEIVNGRSVLRIPLKLGSGAGKLGANIYAYGVTANALEAGIKAMEGMDEQEVNKLTANLSEPEILYLVSSWGLKYKPELAKEGITYETLRQDYENNNRILATNLYGEDLNSQVAFENLGVGKGGGLTIADPSEKVTSFISKHGKFDPDPSFFEGGRINNSDTLLARYVLAHSDKYPAAASEAKHALKTGFGFSGLKKTLKTYPDFQKNYSVFEREYNNLSENDRDELSATLNGDYNFFIEKSIKQANKGINFKTGLDYDAKNGYSAFNYDEDGKWDRFRNLFNKKNDRQIDFDNSSLEVLSANKYRFNQVYNEERERLTKKIEGLRSAPETARIPGSVNARELAELEGRLAKLEEFQKTQNNLFDSSIETKSKERADWQEKHKNAQPATTAQTRSKPGKEEKVITPSVRIPPAPNNETKQQPSGVSSVSNKPVESKTPVVKPGVTTTTSTKSQVTYVQPGTPTTVTPVGLKQTTPSSVDNTDAFKWGAVAARGMGSTNTELNQVADDTLAEEAAAKSGATKQQDQQQPQNQQKSGLGWGVGAALGVGALALGGLYLWNKKKEEEKKKKKKNFWQDEEDQENFDGSEYIQDVSDEDYLD